MRFQGKTYLAVPWNGLYESVAQGEWERVREGNVESLALFNGTLHAGTSRGLYRKQDGRWEPVLAGNFSRIIAREGRLFVQALEASPAKYKLYSVAASGESKLEYADKDMISIFKLGESVSLNDGKNDLYELKNGRRVKGRGVSGVYNSFQYGDESYLSTYAGLRQRRGRGPWRPIPVIVREFEGMVEYEDRRLIATGSTR
ncbi:MAG: hypothetical protein PHF00_07900 [Elusimicrobia bacterium]|nr:hypothetical protein [Elusimicrobiota bacterium]